MHVQRFVPLEVHGLDLIPAMVWVDVVVNGALIIVTIEWGISTKYNGTKIVVFVPL
jgi:hypothetical protein